MALWPCAPVEQPKQATGRGFSLCFCALGMMGNAVDHLTLELGENG